MLPEGSTQQFSCHFICNNQYSTEVYAHDGIGIGRYDADNQNGKMPSDMYAVFAKANVSGIAIIQC